MEKFKYSLEMNTHRFNKNKHAFDYLNEAPSTARKVKNLNYFDQKLISSFLLHWFLSERTADI